MDVEEFEMSDVGVVKKKALKSAKWMVITSILSMFCSYGSNILLGQISPETLGIYSAVNVFISSLTTFVGMGGAVVLSNFFPKMDSDVKKTQLLHTYIFGVPTSTGYLHQNSLQGTSACA